MVLGLQRAAALALVSLTGSLAFSVLILRLAPARFSFFPQLLAVGLGLYLLLLPAWRLSRSHTRSRAADLFNRASYYPLAVLAVVLINFFI